MSLALSRCIFRKLFFSASSLKKKPERFKPALFLVVCHLSTVAYEIRSNKWWWCQNKGTGNPAPPNPSVSYMHANSKAEFSVYSDLKILKNCARKATFVKPTQVRLDTAFETLSKKNVLLLKSSHVLIHLVSSVSVCFSYFCSIQSPTHAC